MSTYKILDEILDGDNAAFPTALAEAYQLKIRPLCMCKPCGVEMYISKLSHSDKYLIKRMPTSGASHHPDCDSFSMPCELSGRAGIINTAISEDQKTGLTKLRVDFSLSKSNGKSIEKGEQKEKTSLDSTPEKLSIRSLLHYLYEEAGLNKWSPRMEGKRNWFVIRKYLLATAQGVEIKNNILADIILIPEKFDLEKCEAQKESRRRFFSTLRNSPKSNQMGLLIGEFKCFEKCKFNHKMIMKHMSEVNFFVAEELYKKIEKHFAVEIALNEEIEQIRLMIIATYSFSPAGNPLIASISMMAVNRNWIPIENLEELYLVDKAIDEKRHFLKVLRYNMSRKFDLPSLILTDTGDALTAVFSNKNENDEISPDATNLQFSNENYRVVNLKGDEEQRLPPAAKPITAISQIAGEIHYGISP